MRGKIIESLFQDLCDVTIKQIAIPDVVRACTNADILIFVLPHQFVRDTCLKMRDFIKPNALGVSLIKATTIF